MNRLHLVLELAERVASDVADSLKQPEGAFGIWAGLGGVGCTLAEISSAATSQSLRNVALEIDHLLGAAVEAGKGTIGLFESPFMYVLVREHIYRMLALSAHKLQAEFLLHRLEKIDPARTDLFTGIAGDMCAIIWLSRRGIIRKDVAKPAVMDLCDKVMATTREFNEVLIYENAGPGSRSDGPSHGLAHGAAGVATALAEAGVFLDSVVLRNAARSLIQSELSSVQPSGFWLDTRVWPDASTKKAIYTGECWCNGTVGITQAVDRIAITLKEPSLRRKAEAIKKRARVSISGYAEAQKDLCVCHGFIDTLLLERSNASWPQSKDAIFLERALECHDLSDIFYSAARIPNKRIAVLSHYLGLSGVLQHFYRNISGLPQYSLSLPIEAPH